MEVVARPPGGDQYDVVDRLDPLVRHVPQHALLQEAKGFAEIR